jgi:hypothetical protein
MDQDGFSTEGAQFRHGEDSYFLLADADGSFGLSFQILKHHPFLNENYENRWPVQALIKTCITNTKTKDPHNCGECATIM